MEQDFEGRIRHLVYRCYKCGALLTKYEILDIWERAEATLETVIGLCKCGSRMIQPTNAKLWEELFLPKVWKVWWRDVAKPWLSKRS